MESDWVTTSTLLVRLRGSEDDAWTRFAERFRAPIVAFAEGQGLPRAEAEDVAQETLLAFLRAYRAGRYEPEKGRLSRWLFGIARRQVRNAWARLGRDREAVPDASDYWQGVPEDAVSHAWDREWERSILERCLARVRGESSPRTFRAFELVVREHRTPADAARELGVSVKVVYNAKHRVLARVRELREDLESVE